MLYPKIYRDDHLYQAKIDWCANLYGLRQTFETLLGHKIPVMVSTKKETINASGAIWNKAYTLHVSTNRYHQVVDLIEASNMFYIPISVIVADWQTSPNYEVRS